jgi:hypothetical protein
MAEHDPYEEIPRLEPTPPPRINGPPPKVLLHKPSSRITVVETVYHQQSGGQPTAVVNRHGRPLDTDEAPYTRQVNLTEEWQALDLGWLEGNVGMLVLSNEEGKGYTVNPPRSELEDVRRRIVEVTYEWPSGPRDMHSPPKVALAPEWYVFPGESMRATPAHADLLRLRSQHVKARVLLTLFPR